VLQAIIALVMLAFLPGYLLINALFPIKGELDLELDHLYRIGMGMAMSMFISITIGFVLGYLGLFYAVYLWTALICLSGVFFLVGLLRGAYPRIGELIGTEARRLERKGGPELRELYELVKKRRALEREIEACDRWMRRGVKGDWVKRKKELIGEIKALDERIDEMRGQLDEL